MLKTKFTVLAAAVVLAVGASAAPRRPDPAMTAIAKAREVFKSRLNAQKDPFPEAAEACDFIEKFAASPEASAFSPAQRARLWCEYCLIACEILRDDLFERGFARMMEADPSIVSRVDVAGARVMTHHRALRDVKTFPKAESAIRFGQTLASMGVKEGRTVRLSDYWNPTNVTAAFQALVDDPGVTTIVLDAMPDAWRVGTVFFRSNVNGKRVLMKSGVSVLRSEDRLRANTKERKPKAIFQMNGCKNVIIESDAEKPEDVTVGYYRSYAERKKLCREEGGSGLATGESDAGRCDCTSNVVFRNFRVADTEQDGLFTASNWRPAEEIFAEDMIFDSNYRQGASPCAYYSLYFRNCRFENTAGGEPMAGCDVEPWAAYICTANIYFFDCTFANNRGGGLVFATNTRNPVLCMVKRCRFLKTFGPQIAIWARPTRYFAALNSPTSDIIFEDCRFESDGTLLMMAPCPIFNMTFRNCHVADVRGETGRAKSAVHRVSPVKLLLNRNFGTSEIPASIRPKILFENVTVDGFRGAPFVDFADELGLLSINDVFAGSVVMNGRKVDLSSLSYKAKDLDEPPTKYADLSALRPPAYVCAPGEPMPASGAELCFFGAWWLKYPQHSYYFWAEKGRRVDFDFTINYPRYGKFAKAWPTNVLCAVSPSGARTPLGPASKGTWPLSFVSPETGWHRFTPGPVLDDMDTASGVRYLLKNVRGSRFAWQADATSDSFAKFFLADPDVPYTGYFEVPAGGRTCRIKVCYGGVEFYDPAGNLRGKIGSGEYSGRYEFEIKPSTDKAEIWSFRSPAGKAGGYARVMRFYAPLNGIWADRPEDLPCVYADHHVPARDPVVAASPHERFDMKTLPAAVRAGLPRAKAERRAFVSAGRWTARKAELEARIAAIREKGVDDDIEGQSKDLRRAAELAGRAAAMERKAAGETAEDFELAAFCRAFMPVLLLESGKVADFVKWRGASPASGKYRELENELSAAAFADKLSVELGRFGLDNPCGELEYGNAAELVPLAKAIGEKIASANGKKLKR